MKSPTLIVVAVLLFVLAGCDAGTPTPPTPTPAAVPPVILTAIAQATQEAAGLPVGAEPTATEAPPAPTEMPIPTELPRTAVTESTAQTADPELIIAAFKTAGLPIGETVIFTAENDPNKLLGRPGGYVAKATWRDTRLTPQPTIALDPGTPTPAIPDIDISREGAGLEIFADEESATRREAYLEALFTGGGILGTEYIYRRGPIVLRVGGDLTPTQAEDYKRAFDSLPIP